MCAHKVCREKSLMVVEEREIRLELAIGGIDFY